MSISITKISKKILLKNKSYNFILNPVFSYKTTENSTDKNTLITNSQNENKSNNDISEKENFSPNIIIGIDNKYHKNTNQKTKQFFSNKNNKKKDKKLPLKNSISKNSARNNEKSDTKKVCNDSKKVCNNSVNKSIDTNSYKYNCNKTNMTGKKQIIIRI